MRLRSDAPIAWTMLAFPLAIVALFTALPTIAGLALALCEWDGRGPVRFVGLENLRTLVMEDRQFRAALRNTLLFALVTVPVTTVAAFGIAVALHARWFVGKALCRTLLFLPTVVSIVAIGFIWRWVLDPHAGLLNAFLRAVGIERLAGGTLPMWLGDTTWSLVALMFVHVWRSVGFCVVLYLAALAGLPRSRYDAASVDGAGAWRSTVHVTWPAVRPTTLFLVVTGTIWALQVFDLVWIVTGGAEQRWTDVLNVHLYREFAASRLGYAAAIGAVVLALSAAATAVQFRVARGREAAR